MGCYNDRAYEIKFLAKLELSNVPVVIKITYHILFKQYQISVVWLQWFLLLRIFLTLYVLNISEETKTCI